MTTQFIKYSFFAAAFFLLTVACQEDYPEVYNGAPFLTFPTDEHGYNYYVQQHFHNFYYFDDETILRDTAYIPLAAMGTIPPHDIGVKLEVFNSDTLSYPERIDQTTEDAIPGVHYVPFDEMGDAFTFHAEHMQDTIPIVLLRDASMKHTTYRITFRLTAMDYAAPADPYDHRVVVYIADKISMPSNWDAWRFGTYGDVKLDFMIRHSDLKWDDDDMTMVLNDSFLLAYYVYKFKNDLIKENEALGDAAPLREADGTVVAF